MPEDWEKQWNRLWADIPIWWSILWKAYKSLLKNIRLESPKIIELGCGTGRTSLALAKTFKGEVTLVDNSEAALKKAKQVFEGTSVPLKIINQDIFSLKIREKYDIVHSEGVIEHFNSNYLNKIINIHRNSVKENGYVIIFVPTPSITYRIWRLIQEKMGIWYYGNEKPMKKNELKKLCEKNGLGVLSTVGTPFQVGVICRKNGRDQLIEL